MYKANIFTYHWDYAGQQWNCFDPEDSYVCSFELLEDARGFCNSANEDLHALQK